MVGGPDQVQIKNVKVIFKKKVVDKTNEEGKFSFTVTDDVDRLTVKFQDPTDEFSDTTQILPFQRGRTVIHSVVLQKEDPPVTFDSSKDLRVPLGHAEGNMAELELPADNLLDKDGKPFKGEFQALACFQKAAFAHFNCDCAELPTRCFLFVCLFFSLVFFACFFFFLALIFTSHSRLLLFVLYSER